MSAAEGTMTWGKLKLIALLATGSLCPAILLAHPGGLDANGCHTNRKTGDYHCHRESAVAVDPPVKKSSSGICHDRKSQYYEQTKKFTAFQTIKACIDSGGRLPK
jgi:hypothetical protein